MIMDEVLPPQNLKTSDQFKHTWKLFLHIFSFLIEIHIVYYLTARKPRLVSALYITGCPIGKLITQHNWKQATANFSHLQLFVTGEV